MLASAEKALASDQPTDMEARYRRVDGSYRYVMTRRVVERDEAGEPLAFVGVALDVTERVEQRQQAEELARRLEAASHAAGIGLWTTAIDPPQTDWNEQTFAIFDRFAPPRVPNLSEWLSECVHPDDRERVGREIRAYMAQSAGRQEIEFRILRRDGSVRWVVMRADTDTRRRAAAHPRRGHRRDRAACRARGAARRQRALGADRPPRRHRHVGSARSMARRSAGTSRCSTCAAWCRRSRCRAARSGWRWSIPTTCRGCSMPAPAPSAPPLATSYEFRVRLPDGGWRWLASRSALLNDEQGRPVRRVGVNWDVTEAKQAELVRQQAVLAEREIHAKSQFLSRMSHELRTPLNAVLGFTQLLQIEARRSADAAQLAKLGHIRAAGDHLLSLINDVLDLSSLESGALKLALGAVDLGMLVRQSVPLVESLAAQHGVVVEIAEARRCGTRRRHPPAPGADQPAVERDQVQPARRPGRGPRRSCRRQGGAARARHRPRADADQLASLFEPFNRFGAENEGIEGTGIGLTIVKALVEGMGGSVAVSSKPGEGTGSRCVLATAADDLGTAEPAEAADSSTAPWSEPRRERAGQILYIEDNQVNVLLVEELVKTVSGLAISSEATGRAGVARAQALRPDLVLIDLQLPDFDGFEVLRRLRAEPSTAAIPCIALSANAMPEDIERGLAAGFVDYWTKPIDFSAFLTALKKRFPASPVSVERQG